MYPVKRNLLIILAIVIAATIALYVLTGAAAVFWITILELISTIVVAIITTPDKGFNKSISSLKRNSIHHLSNAIKQFGAERFDTLLLPAIDRGEGKAKEEKKTEDMYNYKSALDPMLISDITAKGRNFFSISGEGGSGKTASLLSLGLRICRVPPLESFSRKVRNVIVFFFELSEDNLSTGIESNISSTYFNCSDSKDCTRDIKDYIDKHRNHTFLFLFDGYNRLVVQELKKKVIDFVESYKSCLNVKFILTTQLEEDFCFSDIDILSFRICPLSIEQIRGYLLKNEVQIHDIETNEVDVLRSPFFLRKYVEAYSEVDITKTRLTASNVIKKYIEYGEKIFFRKLGRNETSELARNHALPDKHLLGFIVEELLPLNACRMAFLSAEAKEKYEQDSFRIEDVMDTIELFSTEEDIVVKRSAQTYKRFSYEQIVSFFGSSEYIQQLPGLRVVFINKHINDFTIQYSHHAFFEWYAACGLSILCRKKLNASTDVFSILTSDCFVFDDKTVNKHRYLRFCEFVHDLLESSIDYTTSIFRKGYVVMLATMVEAYADIMNFEKTIAFAKLFIDKNNANSINRCKVLLDLYKDKPEISAKILSRISYSMTKSLLKRNYESPEFCESTDRDLQLHAMSQEWLKNCLEIVNSIRSESTEILRIIELDLVLGKIWGNLGAAALKAAEFPQLDTKKRKDFLKLALEYHGVSKRIKVETRRMIKKNLIINSIEYDNHFKQNCYDLTRSFICFGTDYYKLNLYEKAISQYEHAIAMGTLGEDNFNNKYREWVKNWPYYDKPYEIYLNMVGCRLGVLSSLSPLKDENSILQQIERLFIDLQYSFVAKFTSRITSDNGNNDSPKILIDMNKESVKRAKRNFLESISLISNLLGTDKSVFDRLNHSLQVSLRDEICDIITIAQIIDKYYFKLFALELPKEESPCLEALLKQGWI